MSLLPLVFGLALFGSIRANAQQKDTALAGGLPSCSSVLEQASHSLAQKQWAEANEKFQQVVADPSAPVFVRSLASYGLVETALV